MVKRMICEPGHVHVVRTDREEERRQIDGGGNINAATRSPMLFLSPSKEDIDCLPRKRERRKEERKRLNDGE